MNKLYQRINWENYPSTATPINESNLNKLDLAVDGIDGRVITLDLAVQQMLAKLNGILAPGMEYAGKYLAVGANGRLIYVNPQNGMPTVSLEYTFLNQDPGSAYGDIALHTTDAGIGDYWVHWANDSGIMEEYGEIFKMIGGATEKTYHFVETNAIPPEATKVVAVQNQILLSSVSIPQHKRITGTKSYSIGLMSDIHIDGDGNDVSESISDFTRAITYYNGKQVAFSAVAGDMTFDGRSADLVAYHDCKQQSHAPIFHCRGNHDMVSESNYKQYLEPNGYDFQVLQAGDVYLFVSAGGADGKTISTATNTWLRAKLEEHKEKRVYIIEHVYVSPVGNANNLDNDDSQKNAAFLAILADYKNATLITGHSHLKFELQESAASANSAKKKDTMCNRIHVSSLARPRASYTQDLHKGSQGYLVDVYNDFTIYRGRDFATNKFLPLAQYIIYKYKDLIRIGDITSFSSGSLNTTTGVFEESGSSLRSGWIPLNDSLSKKFVFLGSVNNMDLCYYDSNSRFLGSQSGGAATYPAGEEFTLSVPTGATYLVFKARGDYANISTNAYAGTASEPNLGVFQNATDITHWASGSMDQYTGIFTASTTSWRSGWIRLNGAVCKKFKFVGAVEDIRICYYDENKTFLYSDINLQDVVEMPEEYIVNQRFTPGTWMVFKAKNNTHGNILFNGGDGEKARDGYRYMYSITSFVSGTLNTTTGAFESSASSYRSDWIALNGVTAKRLICSGSVEALEICYYNSSKAFLQIQVTGNMILSQELLLSVPDGAVYMVFKARIDFENIQFNGAV